MSFMRNSREGNGEGSGHVGTAEVVRRLEHRTSAPAWYAIGLPYPYAITMLVGPVDEIGWVGWLRGRVTINVVTPPL